MTQVKRNELLRKGRKMASSQDFTPDGLSSSPQDPPPTLHSRRITSRPLNSQSVSLFLCLSLFPSVLPSPLNPLLCAFHAIFLMSPRKEESTLGECKFSATCSRKASLTPCLHCPIPRPWPSHGT